MIGSGPLPPLGPKGCCDAALPKAAVPLEPQRDGGISGYRRDSKNPKL